MFPKLAPGHDLCLLPSLKRTAVFFLGRQISSLKGYEIYMVHRFPSSQYQKKHINGKSRNLSILHFSVFSSLSPRNPQTTPSFPLVTNQPPSGLGSTRRGTSLPPPRFPDASKVKLRDPPFGASVHPFGFVSPRSSCTEPGGKRQTLKRS